MIGTIVNCIAVLIGSTIGRLLGKGFPEKTADTVMKGLGLCNIFMGIEGALAGGNTLFIIMSMVVGAFIGETLDLDGMINRLGDSIQNKFSKGSNSKSTLAEGFVNASLLFCVGSMAIMGSLEAGLKGDCSILYNKSMLDFTSSTIFASTLGIGVSLAAVSVLIYQGAITILAQFIAPLLSDAVITNMCCVGSLMILGIGLNLLGLTKLRIMNYMPAVLVIIPLIMFFG